MIHRYAYDKRGIFLRKIALEDNGTYPFLSTLLAPPDRVSGEVARFNGTVWSALDSVPVAVPQKITAEQAKRAMARTTHNAANLYKTVKALIKALDEEDETRIVYEEAKAWHRNNDMVATIGAVVSLSSEQIDDLFTLGASI